MGEFREIARNRLIESRLTPNAISMTGLVLNLAAAVLILEDLFVLGAFLDSTLDRIEEGIVLGAVCWQFASDGEEALAAACLLVVLGSLMVSYTRARAEALGVECKVGIATRPVRVVILSAGLMFADEELIGGVDLLPAAIWVMVALTALTVVQRVWHVRRQLLALDAGP